MKKNKIYNLYSLFLMTCFILLSRNTMITVNLIGFKTAYIALLIASLPLIIMQVIQHIKNRKIDIVFLCLIISIVASILIKNDFKSLNFSVLLYICIAYFYNNEFGKEKIIKNFMIIMCILAVYSLIGNYALKPYLLKKMNLDSCLDTNICFRNPNSIPFLNLILSYPIYVGLYIRNFGIFTEPAYYQFYLFIMLIILLFRHDFCKNKILKITLVFINIVTVLSTFSSAAYIILPIILFAFFIKYIQNGEYKKCKLKYVLLLTMIVISVLVISKNALSDNEGFNYMTNMIIEKLTGPNDSTNTRINGIYNGIKNYAKSPIVGNKINQVLDSDNVIANTNVSFFEIFGLLPGVLLLIVEYKFTSVFSDKKIIRLVLFVAILLSINDHIFIGILSFWSVMFIGIEEKKQKRCEVNESDVDC